MCYNDPVDRPDKPQIGSSASDDVEDGPHFPQTPQHEAPVEETSSLSTGALLLASRLSQGWTLPDAGASAGVTVDEARTLLGQSAFVSRLRASLPPDEDIRTHFSRLAPQAISTLESTLNSLDASQRLKVQAARDLLDRAGYTPVRKVQVMSVRLNPRQHETVTTTATELLEDR